MQRLNTEKWKFKCRDIYLILSGIIRYNLFVAILNDELTTLFQEYINKNAFRVVSAMMYVLFWVGAKSKFEFERY
jgi:hypothetical protein